MELTTDVIKRWAEKIFVSDNGCWNWIASTRSGGYGALKIKGRVYDAHRISYLIHNGPIEGNMYVCHTCDNPKCCNPDHLFLGTARDNALDMVAKKRSSMYNPESVAKLKKKAEDNLASPVVDRFDNYFPSIAEAARHHKLSTKSIRRRALGSVKNDLGIQLVPFTRINRAKIL